MTVTTPPLEPTPSLPETTAPAPRRIAVFGSASAARAAGTAPQSPASSARAVLEHVFEQISAQAPLIAAPMLDRAVAEGTITLDERDELLRELADPQASVEEPAAANAAAGARIVLTEAFAAIRLAAPGIAEPILRQAVADERLTPAQSTRILERLRLSPATGFRATAHPSR